MRNRMNLKIMFAMSLIFSTSAYPITKPPKETLESLAGYLVETQRTVGAWGGFDEWNYTGPIVAGLVQASELTNNNNYKNAYKEAAERGAEFIILFSGLNFLGDEAYSIARLGQVTGNQTYTDIIRNFYDGLDTHAYIQGYNMTTTEKAAFYISFHAVAAKIVKAKDADIWREAIINYLSQVDDDISYFPVMTLGVATWALAQTGPMDDTRIDPFGLVGLERWNGVTLRDLPDILAAHQVVSGNYANSFYVRFDHTSPGVGYYDSGYTEDAMFSLLGLISANNYREDVNDINDVNESDPNYILVPGDDVNDPDVQKYQHRIWNFDKQIKDAREALAQSVHYSGSTCCLVQEHIWDGSQIYYFFGGELLETYDMKYIYPPQDEEEIE